MKKFVRECLGTEGQDLGIENFHVKSISKNGQMVTVFSERKPTELFKRKLQRCGDMIFINVTTHGTYAKLSA